MDRVGRMTSSATLASEFLEACGGTDLKSIPEPMNRLLDHSFFTEATNRSSTVNTTTDTATTGTGSGHHHRLMNDPTRRKVVDISILVTTSHPTTNATGGAAAASSNNNVGGALTVLCPRSGMIQSSTRIQGGDFYNNQSTTNGQQVGVSNLSFFPHLRGKTDTGSSTSSNRLAVAFGSSTDKKNDSYGMLVSIRSNSAGTAGASYGPGTGIAATAVAIHQHSAQPYIHWKCRLPESQMSGGLLVSPVTLQHVIGGGQSGNLYVWNSFQNGSLIRTIPSVHYRAITCMIWSSTTENNNNNNQNPWNSLLITAGADGMVHCFSHVDLVDSTNSSTSNNKIHPIRSWNKHNLPVTSLVSMSGGSRIVSSSDDGTLVIMELSSGVTIATLQLPNPIKALQVNSGYQNRIFAGSSKGIIYIIDMNTYALHSTVQMGAAIIQIPDDHPVQRQSISLEEQVFGTTTDTTFNSTTTTTNSTPYQSELRGHDRAITSLAVFDSDDNTDNNKHIGSTNECLISGDEMGAVRIWDTRRGCCLRVIYPWSLSGSKSSSNYMHPVTAIHVIRDESNPFYNHDGTDFGDATASMFINGGGGGGSGGTTNLDHQYTNSSSSNNNRKRMMNFASMIAPLQKFSDDSTTESTISIPFLQPRRSISSSNFFCDFSTSDEIIFNALQQCRRRRKQQQRTRRDVGIEETTDKKMTAREMQQKNDDNERTSVGAVHSNDDTNATPKVVLELNTEIERLKQELDTSKQTVTRWELVNNKLMEQINTNNNNSSTHQE